MAVPPRADMLAAIAWMSAEVSRVWTTAGWGPRPPVPTEPVGTKGRATKGVPGAVAGWEGSGRLGL